ncbi:MAG TPA: hypothetical protein VE422_10250 [Terriglobia bacterium]|nr:hypothetical protein [Terriglobia bacterium]
MRSTIAIARSLGLAFAFFLVSVPHAQQAPAPTQKQATETGPVNLTAKSANIGESGIPVKISILRWSTEEERKPVVAALDPAAQAAAQAAAAAGRGAGGRGGRGGGRGDQGAAAGLDPNDPTLADLVGAQARGRGGRGRGGDAKPLDPISTLTAAISKSATVGYLWTNEVVGYSIKYAYRTSSRDGGERIILATDRRLGAGTGGWKDVATGTPTDYEFTLIEIRMDSKGLGEGKASLTSKVTFDNEARTVALDNYAATPAILQNVKR